MKKDKRQATVDKKKKNHTHPPSNNVYKTWTLLPTAGGKDE